MIFEIPNEKKFNLNALKRVILKKFNVIQKAYTETHGNGNEEVIVYHPSKIEITEKLTAEEANQISSILRSYDPEKDDKEEETDEQSLSKWTEGKIRKIIFEILQENNLI